MTNVDSRVRLRFRMYTRPSLLLLAGLALVLIAGEADAGKEPLWSSSTEDIVVSVDISADGGYIVAGSDDDKVYLFDKDSSTPLWSYTTGGDVCSVAISADGEYIVAGSKDYNFYLFNKNSSEPIWSSETEGEVCSVAISADGEYIVAGSDDDKIYCYDREGNGWWSDRGLGDAVVDISADGEYIAAGYESWDSDDDRVQLFNKDSYTGEPVQTWNTGVDDLWGVTSIAISADGQYIVTGSFHSLKTHLFNKDIETPLWNHTAEEYGYVQSVDISGDGAFVVSGSWDSNVYLFSKDSGTPLWNYGTYSWVYSVSISADGNYIAAASYNDKGYLFQRSSNKPLWGEEEWSQPLGNPVGCAAVSADGEYTVVGGGNEVHLLDKEAMSGGGNSAGGTGNGSNLMLLALIAAIAFFVLRKRN